MTRKTKDLYMESFNKLRSLVPDFAPVNMGNGRLCVTLRFKHELNKLCELHCTCIFRTCVFRTCVFQYLRFQRPRVCVLGIHVRCIAQTEGRIASRFRPLRRQTRDGTKLQYALDGV